jgi:hypothetical protein
MEKMYLHYLEKSSLIYELIVYLLNLCLHYYALLVKIIQSIDEKMNWFCENSIPFEWKYWMMLRAIWIELKFHSIKLDSSS